jgi:nitrogen-specific signal transduction histidine kinase
MSLPERSANPFGGLDLLSSAVVLLDHELAIRYLNPAAENLLEISNKVFAGCPLESVIECPAEASGGFAQRAQPRLGLHRAEYRTAPRRWRRPATELHREPGRFPTRPACWSNCGRSINSSGRPVKSAWSSSSMPAAS